MKKIITLLILAALFVSIAGCSNITSTKSTSVEKGLQLNNFVFCNEINGDRDYIENASKTFAPGKECFAYCEVKGFKYKKDSKKFVYHPQVEALIKNPDGEITVPRTKIIDQDVTSASRAPYIYFPISFTLPENAKEGKYTLTLYVTDTLGNGHLTTKEEFFIKK